MTNEQFKKRYFEAFGVEAPYWAITKTDDETRAQREKERAIILEHRALKRAAGLPVNDNWSSLPFYQVRSVEGHYFGSWFRASSIIDAAHNGRSGFSWDNFTQIDENTIEFIYTYENFRPPKTERRVLRRVADADYLTAKSRLDRACRDIKNIYKKMTQEFEAGNPGLRFSKRSEMVVFSAHFGSSNNHLDYEDLEHAIAQCARVGIYL